MRTTTIGVLFIFLHIYLVSSSRVNLTTIFNQLIQPINISYQVHGGYEDVNWYLPPTQASIYYTLWQCSTKKFSDHSTPLVFYLSGGPGMSSQFASFREFGPIEIIKKDGQFKGLQNPWSWNYYAHLVFVDQPVGTGFSFNKGKNIDSMKSVGQHFVNFVFNFFKNSPFGLSTNPIYLAGEGFAGQYIPSIMDAINTNETINWKVEGIILGGALIYPEKQINHFESFLQSVGVVSTLQRQTTNSFSNDAILKIRNKKLSQVKSMVDQIWTQDASEKYYNGMSVYNYKIYGPNFQGSDYVDFFNQRKGDLGVPTDVQYAQFNSAIGEGLAVDMFKSYLSGLEKIVESGKRVLIYNGQNDFVVNTAGVVTYLQDLEWSGAQSWRQARKEIWKESGNIMGWLKKYKNLIFTVIKGAGHYIYEDEAVSDKAMYLMMNNYFSQKW